MLTLPANDALQVASQIALKTSELTADGPRRLYMALCATGLMAARERQYKETVTEITFFAPAESVSLSIGCHVSSIYRWLPTLTALGLATATGHFCTLNGQTKSDGTCWVVRFRPTTGRLTVPHDWLRKSWRCLGSDIDNGRTAWNQLRQSKALVTKATINLKYIMQWVSPYQPTKSPLSLTDAKKQRIDLEQIFDVPVVAKPDRATAIFEAAKAISLAVGDGNTSQRFFMMVLHNLCRIRDRTGADYFGQLHMMVARVQADVEENFARSGFAIFYSRLKPTGWLDSG